MTIAPLWRRMAASLINLVVLIGAVVCPIGLWVWFVRRRDPEFERARRFAPSRRLRAAAYVLGLLLAILGRNKRGPGFRVLGIRRVDARTGGPVSLRSALINEAVGVGAGRLTQLVMRPWERRAPEPTDALGTDAPPARRLDPRRTLAVLVLHTLTLELPALWSPRRQTLPQRLAGTVVIKD